MAYGIQWPSNTKEIIDEMRGEIGRTITLNVKVQGDACPDCDLDPITNTSVDSFCTTCSGLYWINTISGLDVNAHIRWLTADEPLYTPAGEIETGDCIATIEYTEANMTAVENSETITIDDRETYVINYVPRGKPSINRIRMVLKEEND